MMILFDLGPTLKAAAAEIEDGIAVGQLLTPLTRYHDLGLPYAIDNGAYSGFNGAAFQALLKRQHEARDRCLFVTCPDIVGSARRTLEMFEIWMPRLVGWKVALVAQDGIENLPIPWCWIDAVFIGGSTPFKTSAAAEQVVRAAKIADKWVHVGRVNTRERYERFAALGADSCDGSGICRFSHMRINMTSKDGLFHEHV